MSTSPFKVVFCGTSAFAVESLQALAKDDRFKIELVITQPDRPTGRKQLMTPPPVKVTAQGLGLKVEQPENINTFDLSKHPCDFLVVVAYGQLLKQNVLDHPKIAPINVHGSLLPRWRGAAPVHSAILAGDSQSGVTIQKIVKELDAGAILSQEAVTLSPRETFQSLHDTLSEIGAKLLVETLAAPLKPVEQDASKVTICKKLSRADGVVDPATMTAVEIDRKVRALNPWPGVNWNDIKMLETELVQQKDAMELPCKDGTMLYVTKLQPSGKKPMTGAEYMRGNR